MSSIEAHGYLRQVLVRDETILHVGRQHALLIWGQGLVQLLLALALAAAAAAIQAVVLPGRPEAAYLYLLLLAPAVRFWWKFMVWRSHVYVVTSRRVIQLSGVLTKVVIDSLLEKVNDLKTDQSLLGRMFGYGDVDILTASEAGANDIRFIADPLGFKRAILDAKEALDRHER